jgi:phenylalanine-4-hydroxylase
LLTRTIIESRADDWTVPQNWDRFTPAEHAVWDLLFARQSQALKGKAVAEFFRGLEVLQLSRRGIPDFDELNERLFARTGWTVVSVPGLVPDEVFFAHLAGRRFPAGNFIRVADSLDYIEQPDVFHDVFGHVPLLALPAIADFMQAMGAEGLAAIDAGALHRLSRLYWYSVEFGLALEEGGTRIYGAGLLSSFGESRFALDDPKPRRSPFELRQVLRTRYRSDAFQQAYFVIPSLGDLLRLLSDAGLAGLYSALEGEPDLDPGG